MTVPWPHNAPANTTSLTAPLAPRAGAHRVLGGGGASPWRSEPHPWSIGCWPLGHGTKHTWNAARAGAGASQWKAVPPEFGTNAAGDPFFTYGVAVVIDLR